MEHKHMFYILCKGLFALYTTVIDCHFGVCNHMFALYALSSGKKNCSRYLLLMYTSHQNDNRIQLHNRIV